MNKAIQNWLQIAEYDLETAKAMLKGKRYLYVAFMCQQAIEKLLKAIYSKQKKESAPRVHNLIYLSEFLELELSNEDKEFLSNLNQFYIGSRYPTEQSKLAQSIDENATTEYLKRTEEIFQCLKKALL